MAFCGKCGTQVQDGVKFCPSCGAEVGGQGNTPPKPSQQQIQNLMNTTDTTASFDKNDIEQNKIMALLSYLGILVLVPIFGAPQSKFARFHANQGLVLAIVDIGYAIVQGILMAIFGVIFKSTVRFNSVGWPVYSRGVIYGILSFVLCIPWFVIVFFIVIGIINAVNGKAKELPFIGKIRILK